MLATHPRESSWDSNRIHVRGTTPLEHGRAARDEGLDLTGLGIENVSPDLPDVAAIEVDADAGLIVECVARAMHVTNSRTRISISTQSVFT